MFTNISDYDSRVELKTGATFIIEKFSIVPEVKTQNGNTEASCSFVF